MHKHLLESDTQGYPYSKLVQLFCPPFNQCVGDYSKLLKAFVPIVVYEDIADDNRERDFDRHK